MNTLLHISPASAAASSVAQTSSNPSWPRWALLLAAAWNIVGGASALLDPTRQFESLFRATLPLHDPLALFFYRCTWINVIAWGVAYALAASLPAARLPALAAGAAGKFFYFIACLAASTAGAAQPALLAAGLIDVAFAVLFTGILLTSRTARP